MNYHFSKKVNLPFNKAIEEITAALEKEDFGVLTEIDVKNTLKEKLDIDYKKYHILGACNPSYAHKALEADEHIGLMLPCNVIVQEHENGEVEVSAVDPIASMEAVENDDLQHVAEEVRYLLKKVIDSL